MGIVKQLRPALACLLVLTAITGIVYPLAITAIARAAFPRQANGSIIAANGRAAGSALIGQPFADPRYFWGRPSYTQPFPYNAAASAGSNLGPTSGLLVEAVKARLAALRSAGPADNGPVPVDLVTASASGLDPHISVAAAYYQAPRVAQARGLSREAVERLIARYTEGRQLGILGEPRVNVLRLNLALDEMP